jgi:hypothetical protein
MDGLDEDADVIFVLTTNRVDLLEPALAARPGRVDQAVEIKLPDAACRKRLLDRYLRGLGTDVDELDEVVDRTEGVSAAFLKELGRRAALVAAESSATDDDLVVTRRDIVEALDDLLEHSTPVLLSTLGAAPERAAGFEGFEPPFGMHAGPMMHTQFGTHLMMRTGMTFGGATDEFIDGDVQGDDPAGD